MNNLGYSILASAALLLSPALVAETISTSPNKLITIQRDSPDVNGERLFWAVDKRNKGEKFFLFEARRIFARRLYTEWSSDSTWMRVTAGDEKAWTTEFLVLRIDAKSGLYFFEPPRLPALQPLLLEKTKENPAVFLVNPDEGLYGFQEQLPEFREPHVSDQWKPGRELPPDQFVIDLAQLDYHRTTAEIGLYYHFYFETKDWVRFKLLKITRTGEAPPEAYKPDSDPNKPLLLFELEQKEKK